MTTHRLFTVHALKDSNILRKNQRLITLSCPLCKLFGDTSLAARIRISDAYLNDRDRTERDKLPVRDGIAIDRFTDGAKKRAKFSYKYILDKTFIMES
jgi:hypothetical protein